MTTLHKTSNAVTEQTASFDCHMFQLSLYVIAMVIIGLTGLAGNLISIFLLHRERRSHPVTTLLLQSLAAADNFFLIVWMMHYTIRHVIVRLGLGRDLAWVYFRVYSFPFLYIGQTLTIWMMMVIAVNRFLLVRSSSTIDVSPDTSSTTRLTVYRCVVTSVVILSVIYNLPRFFEIEVIANGESRRSANSTGESANWNRTWFGRHPTYKSVYVDAMYYIFTFALPLLILLSVNVYIVVVYRAAQKRRYLGLRLQSQDHELEDFSNRTTVENLSATAGARRHSPITVTANLSTNAVTSIASYAVRGCCGCRCDLVSNDEVDAGNRTRERADWQTMANEHRGQPPQLLHREMIVVTSGDGCIPTSGSGGAIVCDLWKSAPDCGSGDCCSCCSWLPPRLSTAAASDKCPDGLLIGDHNLPSTANNDFSRQTAAAASPARHHRYAHGSSVTARGTCRFQTARTAEQDVTVVMVTVIVIFLVCLTPARVVQIIVDYGHKDNQDCAKIPFYLIHFSNILELLNSSVNFIVYCALYRRFRRLFVESLLSTFPALNRFKFCRSIVTGSRTFATGANCRMHGNCTKWQETDADHLEGQRQGRGQGPYSGRGVGAGGGALIAGCRCPGRPHRPIDCTLAVTTEALDFREICVSESLIETTADCRRRGGGDDGQGGQLKETVPDAASSSKTGNSTGNPENVRDDLY